MLILLTGWLRDLTIEGVEPNPGPAWGIFIDNLKRVLGSEWNPSIEKYLEETFKFNVKQHASVDELTPLTTEHVEGYLAIHSENFPLKEHIEHVLKELKHGNVHIAFQSYH